jgi:hypothetical protein
MAEAESKAQGFLSVLNVLKQSLTAQEHERVMRALPPATRELCERPPLPVAWMPTQHFAELIAVLLRTVYGGDQEKLVDLGSKALLADLKGIYKLFIKVLSPQYVIERGAKLYLTYTRNNGTLEAVPQGEKACEVRFRGVTQLFPGVWAYQRGAVRGALLATGLKQIEIKHLRGADTEGNCDILCRWG